MSAAPKRVTRSQSKRKIAASSQPTIVEAFAKKRNPPEPQTTNTHESPQPAEPVIEVTPTTPVTPAPIPEPELVPEVVVKEEPRPTTTKVAGTKQSDGSKPTKVFPLFSRSKPPATAQPPSEDTTPSHASPHPIDSTRSEETIPQTLEASKPPPAKSRVKKWKSAPSDDGKSSGLSPNDPIVLDLSPTRTRSLPTKTKTFDSRTPFKLKKKQGFGSLDAPLPTEETQHVRGPQTAFEKNNADIPFKPRSRDPLASTSAGEPSTPSLAGILAHPRYSPIPSDKCTIPPPLPPFEIPADYLNQHPVIFCEPAVPPDAKQPTTDLWVDKWAPYLAEHVLGNEGHALYLRDWLEASEINSFSGSVDPSATSNPVSSSQPKKKPPAKRGTKRPRIRRDIGNKKAKKRRRREDDWIVHDDHASHSESSETESHPLDAYLDDALSSDALGFDEFPLEVEVPIIDLPPLVYDRPNAFDMSNTIVLCGPSGSGKTAAVYACASELDWEVFEVYPGVGKRSGATLDNLIGQVGKNHLVTKQGGMCLSPVPEKDNVLTRFLGVSRVQIPAEPGLVDGSSDGTDIPDIGGIEIVSDDGLGVPAPPPQDDPPVVESVQKLQTQAKQSLILLEEVDILYRDDVNFWPTVINIIRDCRRPVVLTCNDINLLPLDQLPVQKILSFTQPPIPVAAAYLSAVCRAEGTQLDERFFSALQTRSVVDLRWCINQCQLGGSLRYSDTAYLQETTRDNWEGVLEKRTQFPQWALPPQDESHHRALFRCLAKYTDSISYLDSRLVLRVDTDWSNPTSVDDELGYKILPTGDLTPQEFAHYYHDVEVAEEILSLTSWLSSRSHPPLGTLATSPEDPGGSNSGTGFALCNAQLDFASSSHRLRMNQLATDLLVIPPFDQRLFVEYESVVREMVVTDDCVEACIAAAQEAEVAQYGQSRRQTRNSQRMKAGYYRYLDLERDQKDWLVRTGFGGRTV